MPSERLYAPVNEQSQHDHLQAQVKLCSLCHGLLIVEPVNAVFFDSSDTTNVCTSCRDQLLSERRRIGDTHGLCDENESQLLRRVPRIAPAYDLAVLNHDDTHIQDERPLGGDIDMAVTPMISETQTSVSPESVTSFYRPPAPLASPPNQHTTLRIVCDTDIPSAWPKEPKARVLVASSHLKPRTIAASSPDPLVDITRIRVRSRGHHCLYPGASFQGTQKSGRNSYDVNVTIVDVDFSSSFLCGYLRIRGLTDDWPELTTYFDAEIIGNKYGFLTQDWGANEQEDMVHWQRFPAFRHVKHELKKPHLTMSDRDRGAVFMRWKERFLVPDHRVQDINGASFAGSSSPFQGPVYKKVLYVQRVFFHFFYSVYSISQPLTILPLYQVSTMSALTSILSQLRQLYDQRLSRRLQLQKATNASCRHYQRKARRLKLSEFEETRASKEGDGRLQLALVRVLPSRR